jgi:hypothetical protein
MNNRRENRSNGNQEKGWREEEIQQEALSFLLTQPGGRIKRPLNFWWRASQGARRFIC